MDRQIEVLAPAGSIEAMKAAYLAGADAAYMGGRLFGARAFAQNPDQEDLLRAIDYAHIHGKRLYLTVNTLLKNQEIRDRLYHYILPLYEQGLDAVLVQDLGVLRFLSGNFPGLPLHASTQMTVYGSDYANWLKGYGIRRIVLPRELSLEEIRLMKGETGLETEVFVHGALCVCYSGQCLMSSMLGGRSGNRGRCAQPCRLSYRLGEGKRKRQGHLLSPKDLCSLDQLSDLIGAGADSLKIEGRMKGPEYAALTARLYRKYADLYLEKGADGYAVADADRQDLLEIFNRGGFTDGYLKRHNGPEMMSTEQPGHAGVQVGTGQARGGQVRIHLGKDVRQGDLLKLPGDRQIRFDQDAVAGSRIRLPAGGGLPAGSFAVMRVRSQELSERLLPFTDQTEAKEAVCGSVDIRPGQPARLRVWGSAGQVQASTETPSPALNRPLTAQSVEERLKKTGSTSFFFENLEISLAEGLFLPVPALNELRRQALSAYEETLLNRYRREKPLGERLQAAAGRAAKRPQSPCYLAALVTERGQLEAVLDSRQVRRVYLEDAGDDGWLREALALVKEQDVEGYLALPHVWRMDRRRQLEDRLDFYGECRADGYLARNMDAWLALKKRGLSAPVLADYGVYAMNDEASSLIRTCFDGFTLPLELHRRELEELADYASGEMIVYGRIPLMVTAQCQQKNAYGCSKRSGWLLLGDRMQKSFPVRNVCSGCYNILYNSVPLFIPEAAHPDSARPAGLRLQFLRESRQETAQIIERFARAMRGEDYEGLPEFTKGHYKRGVE